MKRSTAALLCCLLACASAAAAERVTMKDGTVIEGRIVNQNVSVVILETVPATPPAPDALDPPPRAFPGRGRTPSGADGGRSS